MEEPTVNTYETFADVEAREEIGTVNLAEKETVIAFRVTSWLLYDSTNKPTWNNGSQIPP